MRALRILVAAVVLTGLLSGAVVAQEGDSSDLRDDFSLEELTEGGEHVAGAPPSLRWVDDSSAVYIDYRKTNPLTRGNPEEWEVERLLETGSTVNVNELRFHHQGTRSAGNTTYTLHVVYWQLGTERVETENGTRTQQVPVNVSHSTHEITFSGPFASESVELVPHVDEPYRVTMWLEGEPESARWTFVHKSLVTTQAAPVETRADLIWWLIKDFVIWVVAFGLLGGAVALWAIRRAAAGPQIGFFWWTFLILVGGFIALAAGYEGITTAISRAPKILAFVTVGLLMIPLIEGQDDRLERILAIQPVVTDAVNSAGEEALDAIKLRLRSIKISDLPSGETVVVSGGPFRFLSRVLGGAAVLEGSDELETRVDAEGRTSYKEVVWIRPDAEEVVHYDPEGFSFSLPSTRRSSAYLVASVAFVGAAAVATWGGAWFWIGGLAAIPFTVSVRKGAAWVDPAPVHMRAAHVTMMNMAQEFDDVETLEESLAETYRERARSSKDVDLRLEGRDQTVVSEMLGGDVSARVRTGDKLRSGRRRRELEEPDDDREADEEAPADD